MKLKIIPSKPYRQASELWDRNERKLWIDYWRDAKTKSPFLELFGARR